MKLFFLYCKQHLSIILLFLFVLAVFTSVFFLYGVPTDALGYAVLLCFSFALLSLLIGFLRFLHSHRILKRLFRASTLACDNLPEPSSLLEQDYQELLRTMKDTYASILSQQERERYDMIDYYTLWAHQIKTPIAAMRLILQDSGNDSDDLFIQLFRTEQYVEMVLAYLRLDSSSNDLVIRESPLDGIVKQTLRKYAPLFIRKNIRLELGPVSVNVLTDEKWLAFAIEQVLSNSLKYTPCGGIVSIRTEGKRLILSDNGIGIAPEDLPRVCEKGYTGYNGRADKKATGIGLYLFQKTMQKLGHRFTIDSSLRHGVTVCIDLDVQQLPLE